MSRGFWGGVMIFSLAVTGVAGWYVVTEIQKKNTVEVPLRKIEPVKKSEPAAAPEVNPELPPAPKTETLETNGEKRRILFTYRSSTAKKVFILGEFNNWFRKPMAKKDKVFSVTLELAPGTYKYKFAVDEKRVRDPNNKLVSSDGNSLITVKPANTN